MIALRIILICVFTAGSAAAQSPHTHEHSFGDAREWSKVFDDPERDAWQKPHEVLQALALKPSSVVADIGAGTGYFAVRLAHIPRGLPAHAGARIPAGPVFPRVRAPLTGQAESDLSASCRTSVRSTISRSRREP